MKTLDNIKLLNDLVIDRIQRSIEVKQALLVDAAFRESVAQAALQIVKALRAGGKVLFCGNGGSAADAQHLAAEFTGRYLKERRALPALALCLRDFIVTRRVDVFLILSFYVGPYLAWAVLPRTVGFIYYYLPSATFASLALVYVLRRGNSPRWLLRAFVAVAFLGFVVMLPISVAFVGTSMETFVRLMLFRSWI